MMPTLSVVIPCFNAAAYLGEAIESVQAQGMDDLEIIVIDDGSTDGSAAVAAAFGPAVRVISQPNQGISAARNRGVDMVRAELVTFLDADDLLPPGSLTSRLALLAAEPSLDVAFGATEQFVSPELPPELQRSLAVTTPPIQGRVAGAMILRRTVFDRVGGFDRAFRMGETIDWVARASAAGIRMASVDQVVLRRRIHSTNSVHKTTQLKADYLRVLRASIHRQRSRSDNA